MRYFLHLSYVGTHYAGWQRQNNDKLPSVQGVIESSLSKMTSNDITIMGCGRTDSGVHAMQYFAHFDFEGDWTYDPVERLNKMLPADIRIYDIIAVEPRAHSRYDAISRSYEYYFHTDHNAYLHPYSSYFGAMDLDLDAINLGLKSIKAMTDFRYLCFTPDRLNTTICHLTDASLICSPDNHLYCFHFSANRFLKSMIRIIVSRLLHLGTGKISFEEFESINHGKSKLRFPTLAYPQGLHLSAIKYPYLELPSKNIFFRSTNWTQ
jgi:tRNA pseudouridine38-40 synthase